jgi:hypothetical protein
MLSELSAGMFFFLSAAIATGAWFGGAYSIYRGLQSLPDGQTDVPFFSADPKLINPETKKWRARIYACMAYFALALAIALIIHRGH